MGTASAAQRAGRRTLSRPISISVPRSGKARRRAPLLCVLLLLFGDALAAATSPKLVIRDQHRAPTPRVQACRCRQRPSSRPRPRPRRGARVRAQPPRLARASGDRCVARWPRRRRALCALPSTELSALGLATSEPVLDTGQMAIIRTADLNRFPRLIDLEAHPRESRLSTRKPRRQARASEDCRAPSGFRSRMRQRVSLHCAKVRSPSSSMRRQPHGHLPPIPRKPSLMAFFQPLSAERQRFVTRAEDVKLLRDLNRVLDAWRGSGELERLIRRWIPIQIRVTDRFSQRHEPALPWSGQAVPRPACRRDTT
jgi:hypothetical protein